ncbi:MAG: hypothetical protein ACOCV1_04940 [Bacillota bacterium]
MLKKIKWFNFYNRTIKKNRQLLYRKHGIKIDWVSRMYKTYTLTEQDVEEVKLYGRKYVNELLEKEKSKIQNTLISLNIHEFVGLMEIIPLNQRQIGLGFRFKFFDTAKIVNRIIWFLITLTSMGVCYYINPIPKTFIFGLLSVFGLYLITRIFVKSRI